MLNRGCGLTTSGRTGYQHHAVWLSDVALKLHQRFRLKTEIRHVKHELLFVQQAKHNLFTEQRWQGRNTEIEFTRARVHLDANLDATVLRKTLFRYIQLGHDLDTRNQRIAHLQGRMHNVIKDAVNTKTNTQLFLVRLDVNVGSAASQCIDQKDVNKAHAGCVFAHASEAGKIDFLVVFEDFDLAGERFLIKVEIVERNEVGLRETIAVDPINTSIRYGS